MVFPHTDNMYQYPEKSIGIPLRTLDHPVTSMHRVNPPEHIQPLLVLASCQHHRCVSSAALAPHATELRMKAETRLIFENDDLLTSGVSKGLEFFLTEN